MVVLCATVLAAAPVVEARACERMLDDSFVRLVAVEWSEAPIEAKVTVSCDEEQVEFRLEAPGFVGRRDVAVLPGLSVASRSRLVAVLVGERGRTLVRERMPLVRGEPMPVALTSEPVSVGAAALPEPRLWVVDEPEPSRRWRLAVSCVVTTPLWLGPWRIGPRVGFSHGPVTVAAVGTFGAVTLPLEGALVPRGEATRPVATIVTQSFSLEPELGLLGARYRGWVARLRARGHVGYGVLTTTGNGTTRGGTVSSLEVGGAGVVAVSWELTTALAIELDGAVGWVWAAVGTAGDEPVAALGGGVVSVALTVVFGLSGT